MLGNSNYITCINGFTKKITNFSIFLYIIICAMITYNVGTVNHVTKWFSNWDPQFHSDCRVSICSPHESFILTLCLENIILVMLIVLNCIPDHRSSKNCMGDCLILWILRTTDYMYSQGHRTQRGKRMRSKMLRISMEKI